MKYLMYKLTIITVTLVFTLPLLAVAEEASNDNEALKQRIMELERELAESREKLEEMEAQAAMQQATLEEEAPAEPEKSPVKIGGTLGVHYVYGDYDANTRRGEDVGDVDLDIFRLNADLDHNGYIGRVEYRWYDDYSMMHTAWLGYSSEDYGTTKVGIVRVPFGPTAYGASTSWLFDQHYYVGLSDDMDLGVRWTKSFDNLTVDLAYYLSDEGEWDGTSVNSSRYSYDVVTWKERVDSEGNVTFGGAEENGFEEEHQLNLRLIYKAENGDQYGTSLQYGKLDGKNVDDSGADHYAMSAHAINKFNDWELVSQLTYYKYDITDDTPWGTGDLIPMGAFNFPWLVASEAWIPTLSLRYNGINTGGKYGIHSITPYLEWSSIVKEEDEYNDSSMWVAGALLHWRELYIYAEVGVSDGNYFVGDEGDSYGSIYGVGDFGANGNDRWNKRLEINIRHYFGLFD